MPDEPTIYRSAFAWGERKGTPLWLVRATAVRMGWEIRTETDPTEVTEAAFDEAIRVTQEARC